MAKKLVYIAGPFRAPTLNEVQQNIDKARAVAVEIAKLGYMPVCVHTMEGLAMHDVQQENNGQFWIEGTLEVMRRCDIVVVQGEWQKSEGTLGEIREAFLLGIPVFERWGQDLREASHLIEVRGHFYLELKVGGRHL